MTPYINDYHHYIAQSKFREHAIKNIYKWDNLEFDEDADFGEEMPEVRSYWQHGEESIPEEMKIE